MAKHDIRFFIRPIKATDRPAVAAFLRGAWSDDVIVVHGILYRPAQLPGFLGFHGNALLGILTYTIIGTTCEIVTLNSQVEGHGLGSGLIDAVAWAAQSAGCHRLWVVTTNDNLKALRFYQKRGFRLCALRPGAVDRARELKPSLPRLGADGIPLRDELELERLLVPATTGAGP